MALVFALSAVMKLISPQSVAPLLDAGAPRLPPLPVALGVGVLELGCAVGIALAWRWAWLVAAMLLLAFSAALAVAVSRGLRPRCGCLGDLTDSPVAGVHVARDVLMLVLLALTAGAPPDRPLAAVPGACVVA